MATSSRTFPQRHNAKRIRHPSQSNTYCTVGSSAALACFLPLVVFPGLVAVATSLHVAPTAPVVLGFVQKEPGAIFGRTLAHVADVLAREQLGRSLAYWPEYRIQITSRVDPFPGKSPVAV